MASDNREHQRQSRARKKERVQQAEDGLQDCKDLSLAISVQMQHIARSVEDENAKLRKLLYQKEVEQRRDVKVSEKTSNDRVDGAEHEHHFPNQVNEARQSETDFENRSVVNEPAILGRLLLDTQVRRQKPAEKGSDQEVGVGNKSKSCGTDTTVDPVGLGTLDVSKSLGCQTTSCQKALDVITTARLDMEVENVRARLGCIEDTECKVENIRIFHVLDA